MAIEVRFDDERRVDEIVGQGCSVHLERLSDFDWSLIIETPKGRGHFTICKKKGKVECVIYEVDMRPSETQTDDPR